MKNTLVRKMCILALTALTSTVSCAANTVNEYDTVPDSNDSITEEATESVKIYEDNIPDQLDFGGRQITLFVTNSGEQNAFIGGPDSLTGEIVGDAVYTRNSTVEERLNVDLVFHPMNSIDGGNVQGEIKKQLAAADSTNDIFIGEQYGVVGLITNGGLANVYQLQNLDFGQRWWWESYMRELMLGDSVRYFLVGDFFIDTLHYARTVFYNKDLYSHYCDDENELYQTVLDGKWTIDRMAELVRETYVDINNNGKTDSEDQLGYATFGTESSVDAFVFATDLPFYKRTADGLIELDMINDDAVVLAEKLVDFFTMPGSYHGHAPLSNEFFDLFFQGQVMFMGNASLISASYLRDMKQDFGFLPYPKLDSEQEEYRTLVHNAASIGSVNGASQNLDILGTVLEVLNSETHRTVIPVWYDTALKIKYSRDDPSVSSQMIDLIHDTITTNFVFVYSNRLSEIGMVYRQLVSSKSTNYISKVEKALNGANKNLQKLIDAFSENH